MGKGKDVLSPEVCFRDRKLCPELSKYEPRENDRRQSLKSCQSDEISSSYGNHTDNARTLFTLDLKSFL